MQNRNFDTGTPRMIGPEHSITISLGLSMQDETDPLQRIAAALEEQPNHLDVDQTINLDLPAAADITVVTFNYYDNGEDVKSKWSSSRWALNWQFFTQKDPFIPNTNLAADYGTVQLHATDFWMSYIDDAGHKDKMSPETYAFCKTIYNETWNERGKTWI